MADVKSSGLSIEVDVNVESGLKALKALQREIKKTAQEMKKLESLSINMDKHKWDSGTSDSEKLTSKLNSLKNERDIINHTYKDGAPYREDFIEVSNKIKMLEEIIEE